MLRLRIGTKLGEFLLSGGEFQCLLLDIPLGFCDLCFDLGDLVSTADRLDDRLVQTGEHTVDIQTGLLQLAEQGDRVGEREPEFLELLRIAGGGCGEIVEGDAGLLAGTEEQVEGLGLLLGWD